jgi:putative aldouronate transport system permease protein
MNYIPRVKHNGVGRLIRDELTKRWQLYLLLLLPISFLVVFNYVPMYGAQISFRNYTAKDGILGSAWVGVKPS